MTKQSVDVKIGGVSQINQVSPVSSQKWKRVAGVSYAAGFEDEEGAPGPGGRHLQKLEGKGPS